MRDEFGLELRVALVPVSEIRAQGHDVRIARFAASPDVSYAMFSGGGLAYAERRMKEGAFAIPPAPPGTLPDLTGLSCRFDEITPQRGVILSLIVLPGAEADAAGLQRPRRPRFWPWPRAMRPGAPSLTTGRPCALAVQGLRASRPRPSGSGAGSRAARASWRAARSIAFLVFRFGLTVGRFDPARYRHQLVQNTDFRKFDDGLRMTLDCTPGPRRPAGGAAGQARAQGIARYGLHRQDAALMTCFVPSPTRSDHIHFVDGAMGGYAMAARALKPVA